MNSNKVFDSILQNAKNNLLDRSNRFNYLNTNIHYNNHDLINLSGNGFQVEEYLKLYASQDSLTFKIYLLEERYWTELWRIKKGSCEILEKIWKSVMLIAWNYGTVAIRKKDMTDTYEALGVVVNDLNVNQDILKGEGFNAQFSFAGASVKEKDYKLTSKNAVFGKYNYRGMSAVWLFLPFAEQIKKHFISYDNNLVFNTKKIKFKVKNNDISVIQKELNSIMDVRNNIIYEIDNEDTKKSEPNQIEIIENKGNTNEVLLNLNSYLKRWYYMLGRRYSYESEKKEKMITEEFKQDELNYLLTENEIERELTNIVDKFNKLFKFNAILEKVSEIEKIADAKLTEFVNHGEDNNQ